MPHHRSMLIRLSGVLVIALAVLLVSFGSERQVQAQPADVPLLAGGNYIAYDGATLPVSDALTNANAAVTAVWWFDLEQDTWVGWNPTLPAALQGFTTLTKGQPYFIVADRATSWTVVPADTRVDFTTVVLQSGGTPAGYFGTSIAIVLGLGPTRDDVQAIWHFNATRQAWEAWNPTLPNVLQQFTTFQPGEVYWIVSDRTTTWRPVQDVSATAEAIVNRGVIRIGIRADDATLPRFAVQSDGTGFEPDLGREIAARLFGGISVELPPTTAGNRFALLQESEIDLLIRTTTNFTGRQELAAPTSNYFLSGSAVTVLTNSGITSLADLEGKTIAVVAGVNDTATGTSLQTILQAALTQAGVTAEFLVLNAGTSLIFVGPGMLDAGEVDALGWDHAFGIARNRDDLTTIPVRFDDPYAVWTATTDTDFRDEVDAALLAIINDGTWAELFVKWFGFDPPWTIEEMLAVPPIG